MVVSRRLVAVVVADVVGHSRLMERDEPGTHEQLRALRETLIAPKIAEHGGRTVKTTGDGMLLEFPSATLKIDRSFVHEMTSDSRASVIVGAIIDLAHKLGLTVIAEGVENASDIAILQQHGCDAVQGYLYCRPVHAEAARAFAAARKTSGAASIAAP